MAFLSNRSLSNSSLQSQEDQVISKALEKGNIETSAIMASLFLNEYQQLKKTHDKWFNFKKSPIKAYLLSYGVATFAAGCAIAAAAATHGLLTPLIATIPTNFSASHLFHELEKIGYQARAKKLMEGMARAHANIELAKKSLNEKKPLDEFTLGVMKRIEEVRDQSSSKYQTVFKESHQMHRSSSQSTRSGTQSEKSSRRNSLTHV